jgi:hypothetical protein
LISQFNIVFKEIVLNDFQLITFFFLLFYLFAVAVIDLKTKETPYFLSFPFILSGLLANIVFLVKNYSLILLISIFLNLMLAFSISFLKYRFGFWGGGDFLIFIGTSFYLNLIWPYFGNFFWFLISLYIATLFYNTFFLLFIYFKSRLFHYYELIFFILIFLSLLLTNNIIFALFFFLLWLIIVLHKTDLLVFTKKTSINNLKEEDWLAYPIFKEDKEILNSKDVPYGFDNETIKKLEKERISFVYIKDGIPYLPAFFIALIILYFIYNSNFVELINLIFNY